MLRFSPDYLQNLAMEVFIACRTPREDAEIVANHLVMANLMGIDSHGVVRVPLYVKWAREGPIVPNGKISIVCETPTTAIIDCGYNFGQLGALRATEIAIKKARESSVAVVVTQRCAHVGRLGHYTQKAAEAGMLGLAFVNSAPTGYSVVPFGGLQGRIAPNPISYAVPGPEHPILADMAMSTTAQGKLVVYRNQGKQIPEGWIIDAAGKPTTDPKDFFSSPQGWILPVGGNVGYKGFSILLLSELLAGTLGGVTMGDFSVPDGTNGFCFIAINIEAFLPPERFRQLTSEMAVHIKSAPPASGFQEVLMPGDLEFRTLAERRVKGIPLDEITWNQIADTARSLNLPVVEQ